MMCYIQNYAVNIWIKLKLHYYYFFFWLILYKAKKEEIFLCVSFVNLVSDTRTQIIHVLPVLES